MDLVDVFRQVGFLAENSSANVAADIFRSLLGSHTKVNGLKRECKDEVRFGLRL